MDMRESDLLKLWTAPARRRARLRIYRKRLLQWAQARFPGAIPAEVAEFVRQQESEKILAEWFEVAITAPSAEEFLTAVRARMPRPQEDEDMTESEFVNRWIVHPNLFVAIIQSL